MKKLIDKRKILTENPKVDRRLVEDFERLDRQLKALGVTTKSKYSLAPPLGGAVWHAYNTAAFVEGE